MEKKTLSAVHENDIRVFLNSIGILAEMENGEMRCAICNDVVTVETMKCVFPDNGEIKVCCSRNLCYRELVAREE